ncbi:MAG: ATP-dependent Clp protease ATP-binding subunit [Anaerolineae bacterium]|nr:MAG: ATPase [Chloroflexi bacterium OLB13]MBC6957436.1 ATP-dependent Clp protease ATP-binding subunit [Chloroflexota bacterium]MCO6445860.1 ATP-dependent Clp protease ATP-binding subunit [Anaerolineae bacterium]MDL1917121.1 ATP-dependent Clp protease ATP-binding subunit [Anaerolineae bacterium CFX4]MEB2367214.1 ATP-dependent Clp protease ATP-binding subunit [Chloroflexota bacterium]
MAQLNPDLLSRDLSEAMSAAAQVVVNRRATYLTPELILLALTRQSNTAAARLLDVLSVSRNFQKRQIERQVELAVDVNRDQPGNLDFLAKGGATVPLSRQTVILLDDALSVAQSANETRVDTDHALQVLAESSMSTSGILRQYGVTPKAIQDARASGKIVRKDSTARDVVAVTKAGDARPVYFREALLRDMMNILSQSVNRHVILVGPDGVGKRTLVYSLGVLMGEGKGPTRLKSLVTLDETALLDNDLNAVRAGLAKAGDGILFVPHLHRFFGGPAKAEFNKATATLQKAFLSDNPVIIGTTTEQEYNGRLLTVSSIAENSQMLRVPEPSLDEAIAMLTVSKATFEADYGLEIDDEAIRLAVTLAKRYMSALPLPRSAEHLMHRTAAMVNMSKQSHLAFRPELADTRLDAEDVTLAASQVTGVPVNKLGADERSRYASMVEHIKERIVGQDQAVIAVSRAIKAARVGLKDPKRPIGSFLFLGPTGVGKTELAKALAEFMFGSESAMLPLDMSEFKDESSINRLLGSPSGYVDSEAGGQLTERVKKQPYLLVLFDEVEKAHLQVMDILLQMMEEGRLTDGRGNTVSFSETVIILTSNLGSRQLAVPEIDDAVREAAMDEVRGYFRPEFLNRLDEVVMFNALSGDSLRKILLLQLKKEAKLVAERGITLTFGDDSVDWMMTQYDEPEYGARPLRRIIQRFVRVPLAEFMLRVNPEAGTEIHVGSGEDGLTFSAVKDGQELSV